MDATHRSPRPLQTKEFTMLNKVLWRALRATLTRPRFQCFQMRPCPVGSDSTSASRALAASSIAFANASYP